MLEQAEIAAIVPVSEIDRAVEFYGNILGLKLVIRRDDMPQNREAEFSAGGGALVAYESVAAGQSRGTIAGFRVDDPASAREELIAAGCDVGELQQGETMQWAYFQAPDGGWYEIYGPYTTL